MTTPARPEPRWSLGVLAGGVSRRMGRDKLALSFAGRPLLDHVIARCAPAEVPVLVAFGPGARGSRTLTRPVTVLADADDRAGPLSGVRAMLGALGTTWLAVVPGDMPFLTHALLDRLVTAAERAGAACAVFVRDGRIEPLPQVVHGDACAELEAALERGERRLFGWSPGALAVPHDGPAEGPDPFLNVNDPEALARARRDAAGPGGGPAPR